VCLLGRPHFKHVTSQNAAVKHHVAALAVVGYASHVNPAHELAIADIIREEFGLSVTCGQDVSEGATSGWV
jgi:N-methylhydantoinase A/oxoprolinase/acetone carboxylase beta subunit